jgi:hypothetical protein
MKASPRITIAPPTPTPASGAPPAMLTIIIRARPKPTTIIPSDSARVDIRRTGSTGGTCPRSIIAMRSRCSRSSISDRCRIATKIRNTPENIAAANISANAASFIVSPIR